MSQDESGPDAQPTDTREPGPSARPGPHLTVRREQDPTADPLERLATAPDLEPVHRRQQPGLTEDEIVNDVLARLAVLDPELPPQQLLTELSAAHDELSARLTAAEG
ncbi:MAG: hypothetical protein ACK5MT_17095 [Actinomycetales bacterium]